jgi:hypothetical protein
MIYIGKASLRPVPDGGSIVLAHDKADLLLTLRNDCSETKTLDFMIVFDWTSLFRDGANKVIWRSTFTLKPCEVKPLRITGLNIPKKKEFKVLALRNYFIQPNKNPAYSTFYKINVRVDH